MESTDAPKRIVLRFNVLYEREEQIINKQFFAFYSTEPADDYYSHLMAPNESSKMHIVLDLGCKTNPVVDLKAIPYEVYKLRKRDEKFTFEKLNSGACDLARLRCDRVVWGTDRRRPHPEELDGERPEHTGQGPPMFVS
ncbi:hypothetical protein BCR34DRAFT_589039 [Clohesyomyces aquaticus]|uniref:Uncharacterized protein n=1 Tax=Clohesyomyces aquaticus TaxID=1231657 RepID=A0A1Y1ZJ28_9PLEO|nr:hypothetical protein BCR34DRAFT_589039 [Clohesyomyces aquaticus]